MSVDIQWTDTCPATRKKRFVTVERFARVWYFKMRYARRENWIPVAVPDADMLETLLEVLDRREQRGEGVTEVDLKNLRQRLAECKPKPIAEGDVLPRTGESA